MSRDEVLRILAEHKTEIQEMGVKSIAIFGSTARGEAREDSDVDVLVEFSSQATFDGYMDLKAYIESLLNRSVDLVTHRALKPRVKQVVEKEAVYVT